MTTTPTQLPVPSEKPQDLKFNAGKIDEFVTSMGWTYTDRFGNKHYTIAGINYLAQQVMNAFGYITLTGVDFDTGATVSTPNEVLFNPDDNSYYKWTGSFASGAKLVPPNSTPENTGGIGPGKWLSVGDTVLRNDLASGDGASLVGYTNPENGDESTVDETLTAKLPNVVGSVATSPTGKKFLSLKTYSGDHDFCFINGGSDTKSTKKFKKTGNATVTLGPVVGTTPTMTVDAVAYIDPTSPDTSGTPVPPQSTVLQQLTFEGDDAGGECGLAVLQGHGFRFDRLSFRKTKIAIWMKDVWMTEITGVTAFGQIRHDGGTSTTYKNCFAKVTDPLSDHGAYRFSNLNYSTLINCASDGTVATAYWFDACHSVNLINCGSELPTAPAGYGSALTIGSNCQMTFDGFYCIPKISEIKPLSVIFANNDLTFNNTLFKSGNTSGYDFYIYGVNNKITINGGKYNNGDLPKIGVSSEAIGTVIRYNIPSNQYICKVTSTTPELVVLEPFSESGVLDSICSVTFGSNTSDVGNVSKDIKYRKEGGIVVIEFFIQFTAIPGQSGVMRLRNLPYKAKNIASGCISITSNIASSRGAFSVAIDRNSSSLDFYKFINPSSDAVNATDITSATVIRGSITYSIDTQF